MPSILLDKIRSRWSECTNRSALRKAGLTLAPPSTCGDVNILSLGGCTGAGTEVFIAQIQLIRQLGWRVTVNGSPRPGSLQILHFNVPALSAPLIDRLLSPEFLTTPLLIYVMEPLSLEPPIWPKTLIPLDRYLTVLDRTDAILVNSAGFLKVGDFSPLRRFKQFLEKTICIEEAVGGWNMKIPRQKQHHGSLPTAVWHGHARNMQRWVFGEWRNEAMAGDPTIYIERETIDQDPRYCGDLRKILGTRIYTICGSSKTSGVDFKYPGSQRIVDLLQKFDIGLAPFYTGTFRTVCKPFGMKIQSYCLAGLPIIASPILDYKRFLVHEKTVFFADSAGEWADGIRFYKDPAVRQRVAGAAREMVLERFSPVLIASRLEQTFEAVMQKKTLPFRLIEMAAHT
jgi:hypothetical protein